MEFKDELQAIDYLKSTDWYYARKAETGDDVPLEIKNNRILARGFIRNILANEGVTDGL